MITEFRCTKCPREFTALELRASENCCPGCGQRFGFPRVKWDGKQLVALDRIEPGETVCFITDVALEIVPS